MQRRSLVVSTVAFLLERTAVAQQKPLTFIVPFPAGGAADIVVRLMAPLLSQRLGQQMLVENKPGAGAMIGTAMAAKAPPDGNTLLFCANSLVIATKLRTNLGFDGYRAFIPVAHMVVSPQFVCVPASSPHRTLQDLLAAARARPGALSFGSLGPATAQHIAFELLTRAAGGLRFVYVPYGGSAQSAQALAGGHLDAWIGNLGDIAPLLEGSKARALAITTRERLAALKDVPTVDESGIPGYDTSAWFGVVAPPGTPPSIASRQADAIDHALRDIDVQKRMVQMGMKSAYLGPQPFAAELQRQFEINSRVIDEAGIKLEST